MFRLAQDMVSSSANITVETILAAFAGAVLLVGALLWAAGEPGVEKTDFSVTYIGSRMVHDGAGARLYDLEAQRHLKNVLLKNSEPLIFEHPPFEAVLLSPLGALPYQTAYFVWGLLNIAIWLMIPFLMRPYLPTPKETLGYWFLWLIFAPLGAALFQGQSSLFVLLFYCLTYISLRRGEDFRAGLALGLALVKFQFVIPFVLILLLCRRWQFIKGFALMACGLALLSLAVVGWPGISGYLHLLAGVATHPDNSSYGAAVGMATVVGFVHGVLGRTLDRTTSLLLVAVISATLVSWGAWIWNDAKKTRDPRRTDLAFACAVVVSLMTGYHMFTHDLSPLILAMLLACSHLSESKRIELRLVLLACMVLSWIPFTYFVLLGAHVFYCFFLVLLAFAFGCGTLANGLRPILQEGEVRIHPLIARGQRISEA